MQDQRRSVVCALGLTMILDPSYIIVSGEQKGHRSIRLFILKEIGSPFLQTSH